MPAYEEQIASLNSSQREAAEIAFNAVVAAGAGSGKTKVLASRFLHLVVKKKIPVDRILALTFTRKAASEMRARIYSILAETENPEAQAAAAAFYSAQIETLDSFCASICRSACREYGVSPDFAVDDEGIAEQARQAALSFILQHRASPALISLMQKFSLEKIAEGLFVAAMKEHSSLSSPLDFDQIAAAQKKAVREKFADVVSSIISLFNRLKELSREARDTGKSPKTWDKLNEALGGGILEPDIANSASVVAFVTTCAKVACVKNSFGAGDAKDALNCFKAETETMMPLANFILNEAIINETFTLLNEFQVIFNEIKRSRIALTFRDISQIALDSLKRDEALRRFWKEQVDSIIIDEFQDNNELQKDLLYLISGESEAGCIPSPESLENNKLFFVGDEKQSIYLFRGANVSVFRRLKTELGQGKAMPQLLVNYRTEKRLLNVFNSIFPHVFCPADEAEGFKDFEAEFFPSNASVKTEGCNSGIELILFADERFNSKDKEQASKTDSEAQEVAQVIKRLVTEGYKIRNKAAGGQAQHCCYSDIAILFRSTGKQRRFEQALRDDGIPYQSEALTGLFSDAPANDLYSLLRLAVNPEDTFSYAVVLRSPFAAVDDASFARIMTARAEAAESKRAPALPFSDEDAAIVAECSKDKFKRAAYTYAFVQEKADKLSIAQLVSALWYDFGYRYAVISDPALVHYSEIYDYFFELARQADAKALSLSDFLDSIDKKHEAGMRFDEIDVPAGKGSGVRLMTVHKSKGLEFPIVFIVDAANSGRAETNAEPFYFSEKHSITINTEVPEELKGIKSGGNFFYMEAKAENAAKAAAEIRRLLYVAMTRAEAKVFVSGCVKLKPKDGELPDAPLSEEELRAILEEKAAAGKDDAARFSFLDLLLPAIANAGNVEGVTIREALPKPVQKRKRETESASANLLEGVECAEYKAPKRTRYAASELYAAKRAAGGKVQGASAVQADLSSLLPASLTEYTDDGEYAEFSLQGDVAAEYTESGTDDAIDAMLKNNRINPEDFGTYVHAAIEEGFTGNPARIPQEIRETAFKMAERFFTSDIGKVAKAAAWWQTEYGFAIKTDVEGLGTCVVKGKMDLVFESGGTLFVVDYKTDKAENPSIYKDQIETYKKAARNLFADKFPGAKVEGVLFYLRNGKAIQC